MKKSPSFQFVHVVRKIICLCMLLTTLTVFSCSVTERGNSSFSNSTTKKLSPQLQQKLSALKKRAANALQEAQVWVCEDLKGLKWEPGDLWVLQEYLKLRPDDKLQQLIDDTVKTLSEHPFAAVINPDAMPIDLPEDPGKGFHKLTYYCVAPFGQPANRALSFIDSFLSTKGKGYVLTHQFTAVVWAQQRGLKLPGKIISRKQDLLNEITEEQRTDFKGFSDLYAERTMVLLMYGNPTAEEAMNWIETILAAQQKDGYWYAYKNIVTFDGETVFLGGVERTDLPHPTALSMLAIATFLETF